MVMPSIPFISYNFIQDLIREDVREDMFLMIISYIDDKEMILKVCIRSNKINLFKALIQDRFNYYDNIHVNMIEFCIFNQLYDQLIDILQRDSKNLTKYYMLSKLCSLISMIEDENVYCKLINIFKVTPYYSFFISASLHKSGFIRMLQMSDMDDSY